MRAVCSWGDVLHPERCSDQCPSYGRYHVIPHPCPCSGPPRTKATWRAAISGHEATFFSDLRLSGSRDSQDALGTWQRGRLLSVTRAVCSAHELRCLRCWAGGHCSPWPREQERKRGRHLKPSLSFSASLLLSLPGSLTSLIYGEQSEKTSPSDVSMEMEQKDKVSAGAGAGQGGVAGRVPALRGQLWCVQEGARSHLEALQSAGHNHF